MPLRYIMLSSLAGDRYLQNVGVRSGSPISAFKKRLQFAIERNSYG